MKELADIGSVFTEHWVPWLMLMLLLIEVTIHLLQPNRLVRAFVSLPTTKERDSIFVGSGVDNRVRVLMVLFHVLLLSITMMWITGDVPFTFLHYLVFVGLTSAMVTVRHAMQQLVRYTFFHHADTETFSRHYHYLSDSMMLLTYPLTLMALFYPPFLESGVAIGIAAFLVIAYYGLMLFKVFTCLTISWKALFYLPIYMCTVELLPMVMLVYMCNQIQTILSI